jgi:hypothetical protein
MKAAMIVIMMRSEVPWGFEGVFGFLQSLRILA